MVRELAPLVFIHGDFGDGQDAWGDVVEQIGSTRCALVLDRPGNDDLRIKDARHTFASDAAAALTEMERRGVSHVHLVGHSYGALVALEIAVTRPELLRSLHLIEPPFFALVPENQAAQAMNREARRIQADHVHLGDERSTEDFFVMIDLQRAVERLRGTPEWDRFAAFAPRFARSEPAGDFPVAALDRLPVELGIAIYTGGRSHPVLRVIAAALAARLPRAELIEIDDAHHAVQRSSEPFVSRLLDIADRADMAVDARRLSVATDSTGE